MKDNYCPDCLKTWVWDSQARNYIGGSGKSVKRSISCTSDREISGTLHQCNCGGVISITLMDQVGVQEYFPVNREDE